MKPAQKKPVLLGQSEERNLEDTHALAQGEKGVKLTKKLTCACYTGISH